MATCILLSSCDRYLPIAEFTIGQIGRCWASHPEIFMSGISACKKNLQFLPLRDDPEDWMSITLHACHELLAKGFTKCYLVLDDHPPLAKCHDVHLNKTIPEIMSKLKASVISLYGWGQGGGTREPCGTILDKSVFNIERLPSDYLWKFSLHPGLWKLYDLVSLLDVLLKQATNINERTPWRFERVAGSCEFTIAEKIKNSSYRICGNRMTVAPFRSHIRNTELFFCNVLLFFSEKMFGKSTWFKLYNNSAHLYHYYEGPYPIYWRGLLTKGKVNTEIQKYLVFHKSNVELINFLKASSKKHIL